MMKNTMGRADLLLLLLVFVISITTLVGAEECSGHGRKGDDEACVCDNSWPDAGSSGWTGEDCQVPVFGSGDGGLNSASCASSHSCDSLDEDAWACFTATTRYGWVHR